MKDNTLRKILIYTIVSQILIFGIGINLTYKVKTLSNQIQNPQPVQLLTPQSGVMLSAIQELCKDRVLNMSEDSMTELANELNFVSKYWPEIEEDQGFIRYMHYYIDLYCYRDAYNRGLLNFNKYIQMHFPSVQDQELMLYMDWEAYNKSLHDELSPKSFFTEQKRILHNGILQYIDKYKINEVTEDATELSNS